MTSHPRFRWSVGSLLAVALATAGLTDAQAAAPTAAASAAAGDPTAAQALSTVAQFQGEWSTPPAVLDTGETTDAPLLGNGSVGVAVGGSIDDQTFYLGKNDFFSTASNAIEPLGRIVLAVPGMAGSSYHVAQNIAQAQVEGTYSLNGETLSSNSWVSATENMFVTTLHLTGSSPQTATVTLQDGFGNTPTTSISGSVLDADVQAGTAAAPGNPQARIAATVRGGSTTLSGNQISLTLQPGTTYTLATAIESSHDTPGYEGVAQAMASSFTPGSQAALYAAHEAWWRKYWSQSFVQIPDQAVEKSWYGSLYLLGSVSRAGQYAPGLWGNWILGNMNWNGDYHANYNYEAAFYSALSTNHIAQMGPYATPILQWMANGEAMAKANGYQGVYYPVGISPNGTSAVDVTYNQKSDAVNLASDMVMEYEYARSDTYARSVLPYLEQVGDFWQNYLTWDASTGTYNIEDDAPQEGDAYPQTNSTLSLGLVHLLFEGLIDMSNSLHVNTSLIPEWQRIESHLAPLPTMTRNGQTVFSETSQGAGWVTDGNDIAIQAVFPGSEVGLDSPASLLQTARNTITQLDNWNSDNSPATLYEAAAMVGYDPDTLMAQLDDEATNQSYDNMAVHHYGGGIENLNVTTSGLDDMMLQSFQKDVKVFPDWPSNSDAKFGDLLAYGDFSVSSSIQDDTVQYVQAASQSGGAYTFTNPWPGQKVQYYLDGVPRGTLSGGEITLNTTVGETIDLAPAGTSMATIQAELAQPADTDHGPTAARAGATSTPLASGRSQQAPVTNSIDAVEPKQ